MITKINSAQTNPNFGWINLPPKKTSGYQALIKRLSPEELPKLDEIVKHHAKNPIEVELAGLEDSNRLWANICQSDIMPDKDVIIMTEDQVKKVSSPIEFIELVANEADKIWHDFKVSQQNKMKAVKNGLDEIISKHNK